MAKLAAKWLPDGVDGISVNTAEIDFGTLATYSKKFTISHIGALTSQRVMVVQSGSAATGRSSDENEMDVIVGSAYVSSDDNVTFNLRAVPGPVSGKYKINYLVG